MNDKAFLRSVAESLRDSLLESGIGTPLTIRRRLRLEFGYTDGWFVSVAGLKGWNCTLQVWLDRFAGYPQRKLYYGFCSNQKTDIKKLERRARPFFGEPKVITLEDTHKVGKATWLLAKRLAKSEFGRPALEIYQTTEERWLNYYGIYVTEGTGLSRNKQRRLVERITEYARTVVECLPNAKKADAVERAYPYIENRRLVEKHLSRERSGHLATLRKQKDDYICQVCGFDFRKAYGTLGEDYAEAHHKEPLSSSRRVRMSTPDDLVTVCSNCHRMLHRMKGVSKDVDDLKKMVRKNSRQK